MTSRNKAIKQILTYLILSILLTSCSLILPAEKNRPKDWATAITNPQLDNFYQVDNKVYRSAQPSNAGMKVAYKKGIRQLLNLRYFHSDTDEAKGVNLTLHRVPMLAHNITYPQLVKALRIIRNADSPILVHCYHGSDRTGTVIAAYRIAFQGWSKKRAIHELKRGGYGYHYSLFPNIVEFLQGLDVDKLRKDSELLGTKP